MRSICGIFDIGYEQPHRAERAPLRRQIDDRMERKNDDILLGGYPTQSWIRSQAD